MADQETEDTGPPAGDDRTNQNIADADNEEQLEENEEQQDQEENAAEANIKSYPDPRDKDSVAYTGQAPKGSRDDPGGDSLSYLVAIQSKYVKNIREKDFALNTYYKLNLLISDCMIILFHGQNTESMQLMRIYSIAAAQAVGVEFGACNLVLEREVGKAFAFIASTADHPLQWARMRGYPFIMAFRNGNPRAFYNGGREVGAILEWSQVMACNAEYKEEKQLAGGVQAEEVYEMTPYDPYPARDGNKLRKTSVEFDPSQPIRGFNPNLNVAYMGSDESRKNRDVLVKELTRQQREGGSLTEELEGSEEQKKTNEALERRAKKQGITTQEESRDIEGFGRPTSTPKPKPKQTTRQ